MEKILHIENAKNITGSFRALVNTAIHHPSHYEPIIALPADNNNAAVAQKKGLQTVTFPFVEIRKKIGAVLMYLPMLLVNAVKLYRYCTKNSIRVLHNNDHYNLVPLLLKVLFSNRFVFIVHVRLLPSTYNHQLYGIYRYLNHRFADRIIGVSEAVGRSYFHPKKFTLLYDEHDIAERYPAYQVKTEAVLKLLYLSNYIVGKGQTHALAAIAKAVKEQGLQNIEVHFFGNTMQLAKNEQYKQGLAEQAATLGIAGLAHFHGPVEDIEAVYKAHDVCLMFSESESFSMITMEALFYGVPVIASDCGGPAEMIENSINGFLVPNRDVAAMATAITSLCTNAALRQQFHQRGKEKIMHLLHYTKSLYDVVDELLAKKKYKNGSVSNFVHKQIAPVPSEDEKKQKSFVVNALPFRRGA